MKPKVLAWAAIVGGLIFLGLSIWLFVAVGLDNANKLAGVFSFVVVVLALGLTGYGLVLTRRQSNSRPASSIPNKSGPSGSGRAQVFEATADSGSTVVQAGWDANVGERRPPVPQPPGSE